MKSYYLNAIINFFKQQDDSGYRAIKQILKIIDQDRIPVRRRRKAIFNILRRNGLFEIGYDEPKQEFDPRLFPTQTFIIHLLNGILELPVPLN